MDKKVLFSVLDRVSETYPENIAVEETGKTTTYRNLTDNSNRIAHCLLAQNVKKAEEIGVFLQCGATYLSSILGINKAGGIFMALDIEYPIKRMEYILNHVKPRIILTNEQYLPKLLDVIKELELGDFFIKNIIVLTQHDTVCKIGGFKKGIFTIEVIEEFTADKVELLVNGDDSMYLVNTSGSTGNPKMIEGCHKSLSHFIHWEVTDFKLDTTTRGCILARLSFDLSLREMFAPLLAGGTLCVPQPEIKVQPLKLIDWLGKSKINLIHPIPSVFRQLMKEISSNPDLAANVTGLKNILFAGEALFGKDIAEWRSIGGKDASLANLYGPSETTLAKICNHIEGKEYQPNEIIPLGKPLPNTSILIVADNLLCSTNVIGEIYIKTPFRSKGYYKEPGMTKEKFIQNPLHNDYEDIVYQTGDLGKYFEDGTIAFTGRQDSQVKIRGNRVELPEIEKAIMNYPDVKQAIVLAIKNADGDSILTCYYIGDAYFDKEKLRKYLQDYLPEYMFPSFYIHLDDFPLNLNGKIDRRALPKPEELLYDQLEFEAPGNELEERLAKIWSDVLNLKKVGVNNSFYELGGHSLSVTKVLSRIYKELEIELTLKEVFENATIKKLSVLLANKKQSQYKAIKNVPNQDYYELSFSQKSIWMFDQAGKDQAAYNIPAAFYLYGNLDVSALEQAFKMVIDRHESLRTNFVYTNGRPMQKVHEHIDFSIKRIKNYVHSNEEEFDIAKYFEQELSKPFILEEGPLFSVSLLQTAPDKHLLLFNIHHIISDGWSIMVLVNEITALYNAIKAGNPNPLVPLKIQYRDYADWLNQFLSGEKALGLKKYWGSKLAGDLSLIEFPSDYPRTGNSNLNGDTISFELDAALNKRMIDLNTMYGTTAFISFLTIINILMYKYTGKKDLLVGTPLAGRDHADLNDQIGIYVNILPIRNQISADDTFISLLEKVKKTVFETYEHQLYPFDLITQNLEQTKNKSNLAIIDVLVQSQTMVPIDENNIAEIYVKPYALCNKTSKVDLSFDLSPSKTTSVVSIEYKSNLFTSKSIYNLIDNFNNVLLQTLANVNIKMCNIQIINTLEEDDEYLNFKKELLS